MGGGVIQGSLCAALGGKPGGDTSVREEAVDPSTMPRIRCSCGERRHREGMMHCSYVRGETEGKHEQIA
jgi:hypothetical protein